MSNTYSLVFENYLNEEADQKTVSLLICSLINDLESAGPEDKPELLKTARYVRDAVEKVKNDSLTIEAYTEAKNKIEYLINKHKKIMPQINEAISEAEKIYTETPVTDEDIALLSQLHKPAQRVISRNVSKFNNKVKDINLNSEQAQALNELLGKQKVSIEALWNKIEEGKTNAFSRQEYINNITEFNEDLPF